MEMDRVTDVTYEGFVWMVFALPLIPPARMNEYLLLLETEIEHFGTPTATAFGEECLAYIRYFLITL